MNASFTTDRLRHALRAARAIALPALLAATTIAPRPAPAQTAPFAPQRSWTPSTDVYQDATAMIPAGDGDPVGAWLEAAGFGGGMTARQTVEPYRPILRDDATGPAGWRYLENVGYEHLTTDGAVGESGDLALELLVVFRPNSAAFASVFGWGGGAPATGFYLFTGFYAPNELSVEFGDGRSVRFGTVDPGEWTIVRIRKTAGPIDTTTRLWVNGVERTPNATLMPTPNTSDTPMTIGSVGYGATGAIAAIYLYASPLGDVSGAALDGWAATTFGIGPTPTPSVSPTVSPSPTPSPSPTETPSPSPTESPAGSPTPSPTFSPSPTASPSRTPTASHTPSPSPTPVPNAAKILSDLEDAEEDLFATREYRLGYPKTKTRKNLRANWGAYSAFDKFVGVRLAVRDLLALPLSPDQMSDATRERAVRRYREAINEVLSGQIQLGNNDLIESGRRKFPNTPNPEIEAQRAPFGERDEWKELARAGLHFEAGIHEGMSALVEGDDLDLGGRKALRARGGAETIGTAAEGFPTYTVIDDPGFVQDKTHFVRTELALFGTLLNRRGIASAALVDRLRRLAFWENNDLDGRQRHGEAGEERKEDLNRRAMEVAQRDAQLLFYGALKVRAEVPYDPSALRDDFRLNQIDRTLSHVNNLNRQFKDIRDGRLPTGLTDDFIPSPNKRIGGTQGYLAEAMTAVTRALGSQNEAEIQVEKIRNEEESNAVGTAQVNRDIRETYLTRLGQQTGFLVNKATGIITDPLDPTNVFDLKTPENRQAFLTLMEEKIREGERLLAQDATAAQNFLGTLGQIGLALVERQQGLVGLDLAQERIDQIPARVQRIDDRVTSINQISEAAGEKRETWEMISVAADATRVVATASASAIFPTGHATAVIAGAATLVSGYARIKQQRISQVEQVDIRNVDKEFEIKETLASARSAQFERDLQGIAVLQATNRLELLRREITDLVENLVEYRSETADLWFVDPSLEVDRFDKELQADEDLQDCVRALYDLTRAMEFFWTEKFQNPVQTIDGGIVSLPNFGNNFTEIDDLFAIQSADDAEKYLNSVGFGVNGQASGGWDGILRSLRQSIPAQNQTVILSLREDILGFTVPERAPNPFPELGPPDPVIIHQNGQIVAGMEETYAFYENEAITRFRDWLHAGRKSAAEFAFGTGRDPQNFLDGFESTFSTNEKAPYFFDAREWNARIQTIAFDVRTAGGFLPPGQEESFVRLNVSQEGTVAFQRSFPLELSDRQFDVYKIEFAYESDRLRVSPFEFVVQASVNGSSGPFGGAPAQLPYFFSPNCAKWRIVLDPLSSPANNRADIDRIKDIRVILTVRTGIPPTVDEGL